MSEEFTEFTETPTLTLEPFEQKTPVSEVKQQKAEPAWDDSMLSGEKNAW